MQGTGNSASTFKNMSTESSSKLEGINKVLYYTTKEKWKSNCLSQTPLEAGKDSIDFQLAVSKNE